MCNSVVLVACAACVAWRGDRWSCSARKLALSRAREAHTSLPTTCLCVCCTSCIEHTALRTLTLCAERALRWSALLACATEAWRPATAYTASRVGALCSTLRSRARKTRGRALSRGQSCRCYQFWREFQGVRRPAHPP